MKLKRAEYAVMLAAAMLTVAGCNRSRKNAGEKEQPARTEAITAAGTDSESDAAVISESAAAGSKSAAAGGKLRFERFEGAKMNGLTSFEVRLRLTNSSRYEMQLESGRIELYYGSAKIGSVTADEPVSLPKRTTAVVTLPMSFKIDNPITALSAYNKLTRGEIDKMKISLRATVSAGGRTQNIEQDDIPLSQVLSLVGIEAEALPEMLKH